MYSLIWLAVAAVAALVEIVSFGLITVWFVIGALVAFLFALLGLNEVLQVVVFLVVSVACLVLVRPIALRHRNVGSSKEPDMIGKTAVVVEAIEPNGLGGRVETSDRLTWSALTADGSSATVGEEVVVVGQQSVKLVVERKSL